LHWLVHRPLQQVLLDAPALPRICAVVCHPPRHTISSSPAPYTAIDRCRTSRVDGKTPGCLHWPTHQAPAFLSVRPLFPHGLHANLQHCDGNDHTSSFELTESEPNRCFHSPGKHRQSRKNEGVSHSARRSQPDINSLRARTGQGVYRGLLNSASREIPRTVADVDFTTYDGKPLVSDFNDVPNPDRTSLPFKAPRYTPGFSPRPSPNPG